MQFCLYNTIILIASNTNLYYIRIIEQHIIINNSNKWHCNSLIPPLLNLVFLVRMSFLFTFFTIIRFVFESRINFWFCVVDSFLKFIYDIQIFDEENICVEVDALYDLCDRGWTKQKEEEYGYGQKDNDNGKEYIMNNKGNVKRTHHLPQSDCFEVAMTFVGDIGFEIEGIDTRLFNSTTTDTCLVYRMKVGRGEEEKENREKEDRKR